MRDGDPMCHFPIAAENAVHVTLRVVEDLLADTVLELPVFGAEPYGNHNRILLSNVSPMRYDKFILATGSRSSFHPIRICGPETPR